MTSSDPILMGSYDHWLVALSILITVLASYTANLGLLQISDKYEGEFSAADEVLLVQLAKLASVAIENARLFAQVQSARRRLHSLSRQLVRGQEDQRRRIARESHDEVGQALTALKINRQSLKHASGDGTGTGTVDESIAIAERTLLQVRDLSRDLRPMLLDDLGLFAALRWYVDRQARRTGLAVQFTGTEARPRLPMEIETVCFRVAEEALTNVVRHARAIQVTVDLLSFPGRPPATRRRRVAMQVLTPDLSEGCRFALGLR